MSKSHYSYPPDEFDVRGPEGTPVGVHREPRGGWSTVWPFLLVVVVCGGIAVGAVSFLSGGGEPSTPPAAEQPSGGAGSGDAAPKSSDDAAQPKDKSGDASGKDSEGSSDPSDGASPSADVDALVAKADTSVPIRVINSSQFGDGEVAGLAGKGADALTEQGFTDVTPADAESSDTTTLNTVFYVGDRAESAAAVAGILGVSDENTVQVDALANGAEITAVLAEDID